MSVYAGPNTTSSGLVLHIDPSNPRSYPGSGSTLFDLSGSGNNGTLTNGASVVNQRSGRVLDFDGINDEVILSGAALSLNQMTIFIWAFASNFSHNGFLFEKTTNGNVNTQYSLFFNSPTSIIYRTYGLSTLDTSVNTISAGVVNNAWNLFTATFDGSLKRIYVNDRLVTTSSILTGTITANDTGISLIGRHGAPSNYPFYGQLGDVRLYSRALSHQEIINNFNATRGRYGI